MTQHKKQLSMACTTCGVVFYKPSTCSMKEWTQQRKFCSYSCRRFTDDVKKRISLTKKRDVGTPRGATHPNWKGGVATEQDTARHSVAYKNWRDSVYRRDRWTCTDCGIHCQKGNIIAHHLITFADRIDLRYEISNGVTLCRPCHARVHKEDLQIARRLKIAQITHT